MKLTEKSEIKIYENPLTILTKLKVRTFSKDEIQLIETELDCLQLKSNSKNIKKYTKKFFYEFEKYLKETFTLIFKAYYTSLGVGLGLSFGLLIGDVILDVNYFIQKDQTIGSDLHGHI